MRGTERVRGVVRAVCEARAGLAVLVVLTACSSGSMALRATARATTTTASPASRDDVASIAIGAYPEGPTIGPLEVGTPGAAQVFALLPSTLPAVPPPGTCPPLGQILIVNLRDGGSSTYGPCAIPDALAPVLKLLSAPAHPALSAIHVRRTASPLDLTPADPQFAELVARLPWPLPMGEAATSCVDEATVELYGTDGGVVTYGPCNRPEFIDQLLRFLT